MKKLITLFLLLLISTSLFGQRKEDRNLIKTDTLGGNKNFQFIGIPIAFYTPETDFGFGGGGQIFLLGNTNQYNNRLSNILFSGIYTLNEQLIFEVSPEIYLGRGDYFIDMDYSLEIFPNLFWGIGSNTPDSNEEQYQQTTHSLSASFLKRLPPQLNFGLKVVFKNHEVTEVEEGGLLDSGNILGSDRAVIFGLGAVFNLDSRDYTGSPNRGKYYQVNAQFSSEVFGATHGFNKFVVDLRSYHPLGSKGVLALQVYSENNYGDIPFQALASYGGGTRARGYFFGRFIDKNMYVVQAEYRHRLTQRWTLAGFGLFGEINEKVEDFFVLNNMKPSTGIGARFKVFKDKDTWLRLDLASGIDGNSGFYFGVNEAF